ncbi:LegC family aminotransferase [Bdellovibrio bacteriovorus]
MYNKLIQFIRDTYNTKEFIPLHVPTFTAHESDYVLETIKSTFVSSVGQFVDRFEGQMQTFTGTSRAVATVNGTAALHAALYMAGVRSGDLVITQALTFVATCNALFHMGAEPVFVDIDKETLGLSPEALANFLEEHAVLNSDGVAIEKKSGRKFAAVVPMHTFGHPVRLDEIEAVCKKWNIVLVEDAAESLGSYYKGKHTGTIGQFGALSFNGNKIITTGGGGMVLCKDPEEGKRTKHVTTTAKVPHSYEFYHDEPGFNYRLPNLNAALGCAQMEKLPLFIEQKRKLAKHYEQFFANSDLQFITEPSYAKSNYWLNAVVCPDKNARDEYLTQLNANGVMCRPVWQLMHTLPMYQHCMRDSLNASEAMAATLLNIPSTPVENL